MNRPSLFLLALLRPQRARGLGSTRLRPAREVPRMNLGAGFRHLRARARGQGGFTLVEMLVAGAVMVIIAAVFMTLLESVQEGVTRQDYRSRSSDQAVLATEALDKEI